MTSPPSQTREIASLTKLSDAGRTADVYLWDERTVLKLARDAGFAEGFRREGLALAAASAARGLAPTFRGEVTIDGRPGLLMERVDGIDLLKELEKKPWRTWRIGRELAEEHARLHRLPAPPGLEPARERIGHRLRSSALIPEEMRATALAELDAAGDGDRLCHVDFHPGNLMRTTDGQLKVIDFAGACSAEAEFDHAATLALLELAEPPDATPAWMRLLIRLFRGILLQAYRRRYEQLQPVDPAKLRRWRLLFLAQRLDDGIPQERERILARISPSASVSERAT